MTTFEVKLTTSVDDEEIAKKIVDDIRQIDFSEFILPHYPYAEVSSLAVYDDSIADKVQKVIDEAVVKELQKRIEKGEWIFT